MLLLRQELLAAGDHEVRAAQDAAADRVARLAAILAIVRRRFETIPEDHKARLMAQAEPQYLSRMSSRRNDRII